MQYVYHACSFPGALSDNTASSPDTSLTLGLFRLKHDLVTDFESLATL